MGHGFIKVVKMAAPADNGINYTVKSEPAEARSRLASTASPLAVLHRRDA